MFGPTFRRNLRWIKRSIALGVMLLLFLALGGLGWGFSLLPQPDLLTEFEAHHLGAVACVLWCFNIAMYGVLLDKDPPPDDGLAEELQGVEKKDGLRHLLFIIAVASTAEELLFRGLLLSVLVFLGSGFSILISAVLFALVHRRPWHLGADVGVGILLGIVAVQYGLGFAILAHIGFNFFFTGAHKVLDRLGEAK